MMKKSFSIRMSDEEFNLFKALSFIKRTTMSNMIRSYITSELSENKDKLDKLTGIRNELKSKNNSKSEGILSKLKKAYGVHEEKKQNVEPKKTESEKFHFVKVAKSYQSEYNKGSLSLKGIDVYTNGKKICSIYDLIFLKNKLPAINSNINNYRIEGMKDYKFKRLIWNIEEGIFDEIFNEFYSRNFTLELKNDFVYIDGEYTGLSIQKCKLMINTFINAQNRTDCINGFIKMYSTIKPKYIRIICNEYDNPNLNKILRKEEVKIEKIDNPQHRKEKGLYN